MNTITQIFYAVVDPNWGEPRIIPETIFTTMDDAVHDFIRLPDYSLYTGYSEYPMPHGTIGKMSRAILNMDSKLLPSRFSQRT